MAEIQSIVTTFQNGGTLLKSAPDEIPITAYKAIWNATTNREGAFTVRRGMTRLNGGLTVPPVSTYFLADYLDTQWRYAIAGETLYIAPITDPDDATIWPLAYGTDFQAITGATGLSANQDPRGLFATYTLFGTETKPYIFLADGEVFLKHSGGIASARRVGIPKPAKRIRYIDIEPHADVEVEMCEDISRWTAGDSTAERLDYAPSIWWKVPTTPADTEARWMYSSHTFTLAAGETAPGGIGGPTYIPEGMLARFWWHEESSSLINSAASYGGSGGAEFQDTIANIPVNSRVSSIKIRNGEYIDSIQVSYETASGTIVEGPAYGGGGGHLETFTLDFDEYITGIKGKSGDYVDGIQFITNKRSSPIYGGHYVVMGPGPETVLEDEDLTFSIDVPVPSDAYAGYIFAGFYGRAGEFLDKVGIAYWGRWYLADTTAPATAVGWNLYAGETPTTLRKINTDPLSLDNLAYYTEPTSGLPYGTLLPFVNYGDVAADASGEAGNAITLTVNGEGTPGRATAYLVNELDYPAVMDLGMDDPLETFTFYVKFSDADSKTNCGSIELIFWMSDIPGDTGSQYQYYKSVILEPADFAACAPGGWTQLTVTKGDFSTENLEGSGHPELNWDTISAVSFGVVSADTVVGAGNCIVGFDSLLYIPIEKLSGINFQWTYTYYNSRTNTESDYADLYEYTDELIDQQVRLTFRENPLTTPPMADPDKIRIYRIGGTIDAFRLVDTIDYVPGMAPTYVDNVADSMLGPEMDYDNQLPPDSPRGVVAYDNRLWTWGGEIDGVAEPKNRLRFSKNVDVEHFPTDNYVYVGPSEEILRAYEHDAQLFVFTTIRDYRVIGSDGNYRAVTTPAKLGIMSPFDVCGGTGGMFVRSHSGIHEYPSGRKISEPINNIFVGGETVNEHPPVVAGQEWQECMEFRDGKMYFSYPSDIAGSGPTASNDRTLVWDAIYERWSTYLYGSFSMHYEARTNKLISSTLLRYSTIVDGAPDDLDVGGAWPLELESGYADECYDIAYGGQYTFGIPYLVDTKEYDLGAPDQEKQFIDFVVDAECHGAVVSIDIARDPSASAPGMHESLGTITGTGRVQTILPVPSATGNSVTTRRLQIRIYGTTPTDATEQFVLYKIIHRFLVEPPRHGVFVTPWSDYGVPTPKFFRELWMEMDTFGAELDSIEVQLDQAVAQIIQGSGDPAVPFLYAAGRKKFYFGLDIDLRGDIGRLKVLPTGANEVKVYDHGFQTIAEPPEINTLQSPYSDQEWPYYKLWKEVVLDIDTLGAPIIVYFWLDGVVRESWEVNTSTRKEVTHSLAQDLLGKLGRITINEAFLNECDDAIKFRYYKHNYVVDKQPPDVTIADSYIQTFGFDRVKILRRLWLTIKNPDSDVTIEIFVDGVQRSGTLTLPADPLSTGYSKRRVDLPPGIKGYLFRIVFKSPLPVQIYADQTELEGKGLNADDTYGRLKLASPQTM